MDRLYRGKLRLAAIALTWAVATTWSGGELLAQEEVAGRESYRTPRGAFISPGAPADLTLLYTGDVIGYLDPCG